MSLYGLSLYSTQQDNFSGDYKRKETLKKLRSMLALLSKSVLFLNLSTVVHFIINLGREFKISTAVMLNKNFLISNFPLGF